MAFSKKTWKDRVSQYINRRLLTDSDGNTQQVTVTRDEGSVTEAGDAFSASNMNDLEDRIEDAFDALTAADIPYSSGVSVADKLATIPTILEDGITWSITPSANTNSLFKIGNVVFLNIRADFNSAIPVDTNICKLPNGFIPSVQTSIPAMASNNTAGSDNGWRTFNFKVLTNGYIQQGNTNGLKSFFISTMFKV